MASGISGSYDDLNSQPGHLAVVAWVIQVLQSAQ
jgi:hypothetical protein